jgi:U3 small nucleolar RNA-associated protein 19
VLQLIGAEVGKEMKKTPVVEYQIPKHIFMDEAQGSELNSLGLLMSKVLDNQ